MKHFWLGLGLLAGILTLSLLAAWITERQLPPIADQLELAAGQVMDGRWEQGVHYAGQARDAWDSVRKTTSALSSHSLPEQMEEMFALLDVFAQARDQASFASVCMQLARLTSALYDAQQLYWWSLL